jgi:tight adherence protein C
MVWAIAGAVFIATFYLTYGLSLSWTKWSRVKERAGQSITMSAPPLLKSEVTASPLKRWLIKWLSYSGQWALPDMDKVSEMRKSLIQAGYRHPKAPGVYLGLRVVTAVGLTLPLVLYFVIRAQLGTFPLLMAAALCIIGFFLPTQILAIKISRRQELLDKALPDILDMFVIAMDAGLSLNAALNRVGEEIHGIFDDFYDELQIISKELNTGITWDEAFDNFVKRTDVPSIRSMVSLMTQTGKLGGSIGDALRHHSEFTRTQRLLRAEERAAKLPVKMVFPMLFCIFPAIVIVVVGPGLIHVYEKFIKGALISGMGNGGGFGAGF